MARCGIGAKVGFFVGGAGIGALLALLFAPKTGEQTRKLIAKKAEEGKDYVASKGREFRGRLKSWWKRARN